MAAPPKNRLPAQPTHIADTHRHPPYSQTGGEPYIPAGRWKNKWVAWFLCLFLGLVGAHKFYEEDIPAGIVYLCTGGSCGISWVVDLILLLRRSNPYRVI